MEFLILQNYLNCYSEYHRNLMISQGIKKINNNNNNNNNKEIRHGHLLALIGLE